MSSLLSTYSNGRDNNFNLVRFVAAVLVLYTHSFALVLGPGDAEPLCEVIGMTWGGIAVDVFFITSGFLITSSYLSRNNLLLFTWARILRIYPALVFAILFCVFIVGLGFTTLSASEYLTSGQTLKFLLKNPILIFGLEYDLPAVFANNPWKDAVNGSLWTLPYEVKMYAILALVLYGSGRIQSQFNVLGSPKHYLLLIAVVSVVANIANHFHPFVLAQFVQLFSMFFVGATFYAWREHVRMSLPVFVICILVLLASALNSKIFFLFYVISLPYLTLFVAFVPSGGVRKFNKIGDYSYGMYIYAFPVQQSIAALVPGISVASMIVASFSVTFFLSVLSWHLIEKRCLKMKSSQASVDLLVKNLRLDSKLNWIKRSS